MNTFYHYDSFSTLVFPIKASYQEADVIRGFIAIRLLREINGRVGFIPPNGDTYNLIKEKQFHRNMTKLALDLDSWVCNNEKKDLKGLIEIILVIFFNHLLIMLRFKSLFCRLHKNVGNEKTLKQVRSVILLFVD